VRVLCLAADASSNSLVRVYPIAKVLERNHQVTIAGFRSGGDVFAPYRDEFEFVTPKYSNLPRFLRQMRDLVRSLEADVVYAFKPLSTSLWTGFEARRKLDAPLVVDIEDWEAGWYWDRALSDQLKHLAHVAMPNSYLWTMVNELLLRRADQKLVVSRFLQRRFGGVLLPHGADTSVFDPARWKREEALADLSLPDAEYVVFAGTPMPSKGVEDLLEALRKLGRADVKLLLVGSFKQDQWYRQLLLDRYGDLLHLVGPRPHSEMPAFLAAASVVALPQRISKETLAQVPGKVYEAMAMARPILATNVSDLPEILDGAGVIVPPSDVDALAEALGRLLEDPAERARMGEAARRRCEDFYSWDAMEKILEGELARLSSGRSPSNGYGGT
jgi:glycosyltransferase involved in cell wall biosynthesis